MITIKPYPYSKTLCPARATARAGTHFLRRRQLRSQGRPLRSCSALDLFHDFNRVWCFCWVSSRSQSGFIAVPGCFSGRGSCSLRCHPGVGESACWRQALAVLCCLDPPPGEASVPPATGCSPAAVPLLAWTTCDASTNSGSTSTETPPPLQAIGGHSGGRRHRQGPAQQQQNSRSRALISGPHPQALADAAAASSIVKRLRVPDGGLLSKVLPEQPLNAFWSTFAGL